MEESAKINGDHCTWCHTKYPEDYERTIKDWEIKCVHCGCITSIYHIDETQYKQMKEIFPRTRGMRKFCACNYSTQDMVISDEPNIDGWCIATCPQCNEQHQVY